MPSKLVVLHHAQTHRLRIYPCSNLCNKNISCKAHFLVYHTTYCEEQLSSIYCIIWRQKTGALFSILHVLVKSALWSILHHFGRSSHLVHPTAFCEEQLSGPPYIIWWGAALWSILHQLVMSSSLVHPTSFGEEQLSILSYIIWWEAAL